MVHRARHNAVGFPSYPYLIQTVGMSEWVRERHAKARRGPKGAPRAAEQTVTQSRAERGNALR
eukprot:1270861-Pyramimonas_sp.AAC.1